MKVLIVNTWELEGGAARAANRLHKALLEEGVDSFMMVQRKESNDFKVFGPSNRKENISSAIRPTLDKERARKYNNEAVFSSAWVSSKTLIDKINSLAPDVVHLHWINEGMLKIEDIAKIYAPVVWTMHDMWPFTGGCHYDEWCGRYTQQCGKCKVLRSDNENDLSRKVFNRKQKTYNQKDMTIVGLSKWLYNSSKQSTLFKKFPHVNLPNPINTEIFKPVGKQIARSLWNLPSDKKLVLFGAMSATSDPRKGYSLLKEALNSMNLNDVELVVFGGYEPEHNSDFSLKAHYLGRLHDDVSLTTLYSLADVMVVPSLQENLSNAIMESLACGTPVVGFNIGGNPDMIVHQENGFLAEESNAQSLKEGIEWVLTHNNDNSISENARKSVLAKYDSKKVVKQYVDLYKSILNQ